MESVPSQNGVQAMSRVTTIPIFHSSFGRPWGTLILKCQNRGGTAHCFKWQQQTSREFTLWGGSRELAKHGPQANIWSCFLRQWIFHIDGGTTSSRNMVHGHFKGTICKSNTSDLIWRGLWCYITSGVLWSDDPWQYKKQHACLRFNNILVTIQGLL